MHGNRAGCALALSVAIAAAGVTACSAAPATARPDITIDASNVYPESMDAGPDGTIYIGSIKGIVFRAAPGSAKAVPWIRPNDANGLLSLLGIRTDPAANTLWVCSAVMPLRKPVQTGVSELAAFDLKTGALKGTYPFPAPASTCNDITIAKNGMLFVSDTANGRIFTLTPGAKALQLFGQDARLKGIDGIVLSGNGTLYANNVVTNKLYRVDRKPDGSFAGVTELTLSRPVGAPDGFRLIHGHRFLLAEGSKGRIDTVTIADGHAKIHTLKAGFMSPPGVTWIGHTAYALEGKINYLIDPKLKGKNPGPFKAYAVPLDSAH